MKLPRLTVRRLMIVVVPAALACRPVIWTWEVWRRWMAYSEWAAGPKAGPCIYPPVSPDNIFVGWPDPPEPG